MMSDQMGMKLKQAASSVLESMFMSPVIDDQEFPPPWVVDPILIGLNFRGEVEGFFAMACETNTAWFLARAFMCMEQTEEMSRQAVIEVLAELANMLCGSFLGQLNYIHPFQLSSPAEQERERFPVKGHTFQRTITVETGSVTMMVAIQD